MATAKKFAAFAGKESKREENAEKKMSPAAYAKGEKSKAEKSAHKKGKKC